MKSVCCSMDPARFRAMHLYLPWCSGCTRSMKIFEVYILPFCSSIPAIRSTGLPSLYHVTVRSSELPWVHMHVIKTRDPAITGSTFTGLITGGSIWGAKQKWLWNGYEISYPTTYLLVNAMQSFFLYLSTGFWALERMDINQWVLTIYRPYISPVHVNEKKS